MVGRGLTRGSYVAGGRAWRPDVASGPAQWASVAGGPARVGRRRGSGRGRVAAGGSSLLVLRLPGVSQTECNTVSAELVTCRSLTYDCI